MAVSISLEYPIKDLNGFEYYGMSPKDVVAAAMSSSVKEQFHLARGDKHLVIHDVVHDFEGRPMQLRTFVSPANVPQAVRSFLPENLENVSMQMYMRVLDDDVAAEWETEQMLATPIQGFAFQAYERWTVKFHSTVSDYPGACILCVNTEIHIAGVGFPFKGLIDDYAEEVYRTSAHVMFRLITAELTSRFMVDTGDSFISEQDYTDEYKPLLSPSQISKRGKYVDKENDNDNDDGKGGWLDSAKNGVDGNTLRRRLLLTSEQLQVVNAEKESLQKQLRRILHDQHIHTISESTIDDISTERVLEKIASTEVNGLSQSFINLPFVQYATIDDADDADVLDGDVTTTLEQSISQMRKEDRLVRGITILKQILWQWRQINLSRIFFRWSSRMLVCKSQSALSRVQSLTQETRTRLARQMEHSSHLTKTVSELVAQKLKVQSKLQDVTASEKDLRGYRMFSDLSRMFDDIAFSGHRLREIFYLWRQQAQEQSWRQAMDKCVQAVALRAEKAEEISDNVEIAVLLTSVEALRQQWKRGFDVFDRGVNRHPFIPPPQSPKPWWKF